MKKKTTGLKLLLRNIIDKQFFFEYTLFTL